MQVVAEDFAVIRPGARRQPIALPAVPTPLASFLRRYETVGRAGRFHADATSWLERAAGGGESSLLVSKPSWTGLTVCASMRYFPVDFGACSKHVLAHARARAAAPGDVLLAASAAAVRDVTGTEQVAALMMSSGRDQPLLGDLSRTVGCLANLVPVAIDLRGARDFDAITEAARRAVASLPSGGFTLASALSHEPSDTRLRLAKLLFDSQLFINYKGVLGPRSPLGPTCLRCAARRARSRSKA